MKKTLLILLILAGCGSKDTDEATEGQPSAADPAAQVAAAPGPDPAQLQALVDRAMALAIPNAGKAQYRNVRAGAGGTACGEVSTPGPKGAPGPFRPFLVTNDAIALVANGPTINFEDPDDILADGWIRWCATPEELQALAPTLKRAAAGAAAAGPDEVNVSDIPVLDLPPTPPPAEPHAPPAAAKAAPTPPPQIDSFFNSVQRQRE
ncbi:MAG TPA: hypothetical protein VGB70_07755 [Allosphingosinicella sp.]|jgi:hypothetical protein